MRKVLPSRVLTQTRLWFSVAALLLAGCDTTETIETVTVLAHKNCKASSEGLQRVTLADVARFRGSELLGPDTAALQPDASLPQFIAISRGAQPTRGFELHLADQARVDRGDAVKIPVYWTTPDVSKPHPLVTTHPCLVVSIPDRQWRSIEAIDQHGESLGMLQPAPGPSRERSE